MDIEGLSMAAHAQPVNDRAEGEKALRILMERYPPQGSVPLPMPKPKEVRIFRVMPTMSGGHVALARRVAIAASE